MWLCLLVEFTVCVSVCVCVCLCVFTSSDTDAGHRHVETVKKSLVGKSLKGLVSSVA